MSSAAPGVRETPIQQFHPDLFFLALTGAQEARFQAMDPAAYRQSIFQPPARAGFFSRAFFYAYNSSLPRLLGHSDGGQLLRLFAVAVALVALVIGLVAGTIADPFLVFGDGGYERPSVIYARRGNGQFAPIAEFYRFSRRVIHLSEKPFDGMRSKAARAFVAMEDNQFESHFGVDLRSVLRAMVVNLLAGRIKEGASTITQQVARLRFLSRRRSFARKAREALLAVLLELKLSKPAILETYLNEVPLGHGTIGVEAAARFYFEKGAHELTWGEAAVLAALTTRPRDFSPLRSPQESRRKVQVVFRKLVENGILSIKDAEAESERLDREFYMVLNRSPNDSAFGQRLNLHPYASEYVKSLLPARIRERLYTGGFQIYTTIRKEHQEAAERSFVPYLQTLTRQRRQPPFRQYRRFDQDFSTAYALARRVLGLPDFRVKSSRLQRRFDRAFNSQMRDAVLVLNGLAGDRRISGGLDYRLQNEAMFTEEDQSVEGSLVSLRPHSGEITAVIGGSGFSSKNQLLRFAMSRRHPGSSFKPLVYAAGIEYSGEHIGEEGLENLTAATVIDDSPDQFVNPDLSEYAPENYDMTYDGLIRLRKGLALSKNIVAVKVYHRLKAYRINPIAEKILALEERGRGPKKLHQEATVALGSQEMTALEMARGFSVFASGGRRVHPHVLLYITDSAGRMVRDFRPEHAKLERVQVIRPGTAEIMVSLLRDAVAKGTGAGAYLPGYPTAGKTGTSNRYKDAWFVGFTPKLVTALHIGYDRARTLAPGGSGGGIAAPAWRRYMAAALAGEGAGQFEFPGSDVVRAPICARSGKKPGPRCTEVITELFLPGTVPTHECDEHQRPGERDVPGLLPSGEDVLRD